VSETLGFALAPRIRSMIATGHTQHPGLERADSRIVMELADVPRHGDDRFLDYVLCLGVGQTRLEGHGVDQAPIGVEELLPARLILRSFNRSSRLARSRWCRHGSQGYQRLNGRDLSSAADTIQPPAARRDLRGDEVIRSGRSHRDERNTPSNVTKRPPCFTANARR